MIFFTQFPALYRMYFGQTGREYSVLHHSLTVSSKMRLIAIARDVVDNKSLHVIMRTCFEFILKQMLSPHGLSYMFYVHMQW